MPGTAPPTAGEGLAVWLAVKPFLDVLFKHNLHERIHLRFNFASARSHVCMVHSAREGPPWARTVNFHTRKIAKASSSWKENSPSCILINSTVWAMGPKPIDSTVMKTILFREFWNLLKIFICLGLFRSLPWIIFFSLIPNPKNYEQTILWRSQSLQVSGP